MKKEDFDFLEGMKDELYKVVINQSACSINIPTKDRLWSILEDNDLVVGLCPKCPSNYVSICTKAYNLYVNNKENYKKVVKNAKTKIKKINEG